MSMVGTLVESIETLRAPSSVGLLAASYGRIEHAIARPRILALVVVVLGSWLTVGCATSPDAEDPAAATEPKIETWGKVDRQDIEYPNRIGSLSLVEVDDYDEVELGVRLRYSDSTHPRAVIDVYVYPISKPKSLSLTRVLDMELAAVAEGTEHVARQRGLKAGKAASFPFGLSGEATPSGIGLLRTLSSQTDELESLTYIVVREHRFFKIRLTLRGQDSPQGTGDYLQEVIDVLQPEIRLKAPLAKPDFVIKVYRNVFLAPQSESCNLAGWMMYGLAMKEQIEAGNYRDTFARELEARRRALSYWREVRDEGKPCPSDVLDAMSRADEVGFLSEYVFEAYGRGSWAAPDDLRLDEWRRWAEANIAVHDPVVDPGVAVEWRSEDEEDAAEPEKGAVAR